MNELMIPMPEGKLAVQTIEDQLISIVLSGDVDPLKVECWLKGIEEAINKVRKNDHVRGAVIEAASAHPEKTFEVYGMQITKKLTPARYDYTACNDPVWSDLDAQIKELTEKRKEREKFLQAIKDNHVTIDPATGEVIELYAPVKEQSETLSFKLI